MIFAAIICCVHGKYFDKFHINVEKVSSLGKFKSAELAANGSSWKFLVEKVGDSVSMFLIPLSLDRTKLNQYEISVSFTVNGSTLPPFKQEFRGDLQKKISKIGSSSFMSWNEFENLN